ncbi:MAG: histidine kinase dimerization/phosphoacceptor domain -containing protein [Spirochaetia bacterium]
MSSPLRKTVRLRWVLVVFFTSLSLLPLALFGTLTAVFTASYFTKQFTATNRQIVDAVTYRLEDFLYTASRVIEHLGDSIDRAEASSVQVHMDSLRDSFPFFESFRILDRGGTLVYISPPDPGLIGHDMSSTAYFSGGAGETVFSEPFISAATGKLTMTVSYRAGDGTVAGSMQLSKLYDIVHAFSTEATGSVIITDSAGYVIAHPDSRFVRERYNYSARPYIHAAREGTKGTIPYTEEGDRYLATVATMPRTGWIISVTQKKWHALRYLRSFLTILAAAGLSSIGTALSISWIVGRRIFRPLTALQRSSNRLARGNYQETPEDVRYEEFRDVIHAFNRMSRAIRQREEELTRSREGYRALIEHANSIIIRWDTDLKYTFFNEYAQKFFGYSAEEVLGKSLVGITVPESESTGRDLMRMLEDILHDPVKYSSNQNEVVTRRGERRWIQWSNRPIYDENGNLTEILSIGTDRTEFRRAEEQINRSLQEKEILLKEIHHRVKNNMQIISSLINLQSQSMHDVRDADLLQECQNRVHSMALIHEQLYQSDNLADIDLESFIRDLVGYMSDTYLNGRDSVRFELKTRKRRMDLEHAVPCALILGELVSNALKYAFPGSPKNGIIEIVIDDGEGPGRTRLFIRDDGIGMDVPADTLRHPGMGLQLVSALTQQLHGELTVESGRENGGGTSFTIDF